VLLIVMAQAMEPISLFPLAPDSLARKWTIMHAYARASLEFHGRWADLLGQPRSSRARDYRPSFAPCHANARCSRFGRGYQCACGPLPSQSKLQPHCAI